MKHDHNALIDVKILEGERGGGLRLFKGLRLFQTLE